MEDIAVADKGSVVVGPMTRGMRWQLDGDVGLGERDLEGAIASKPIVTC